MVAVNKKLNSSSLMNDQNNGSYNEMTRSTLASSAYSEAVSDFFRNSSSVNMNSVSILSDAYSSMLNDKS